MTRYRKIEVPMWTDESFLALSGPQPNAQTLWVWLISGPRTTPMPGLVIAREEVIASDLCWPLEGSRQAFDEVLSKGMAKADKSTGVIVLSKALRDGSGEPRETSRPQSPNVIRGWAKAWEMVPECPLSFEYLLNLNDFVATLHKGFAEAFAEAFRKPLAKASRIPSPIQESGIRKQETGEREPPSRAHAIPPQAPTHSPVPGPSGALSPDPRIKINHDAWCYAAQKHAELRAAGIDPNAVPFPPMPVGQGMHDLVERTRELAPSPANVEYAIATHRRRIDVAVVEAQHVAHHLKWFTPSRLWARESFWKAAEITPAQAAQRAPARGAAPATTPIRFGSDDDEPDLRVDPSGKNYEAVRKGTR
jgi:hypothetical protein